MNIGSALSSIRPTPPPTLQQGVSLINATGGGDEPVDNSIRKGWNEYINWLDSKGLKGKPELDKNNYGFKVLEEFRKEHPNSPITKERIPIIQKEFSNYRQWVLDKVKAGKADIGNVKEEDFMKNLSITDGIPGQFTTAVKFPDEYLVTRDQSAGTQKIEKKGFSTIQ